MIHRFATFEIDEATREVRAGTRVLTLQPRVFDLMVYLVRHRDRVVPKDELLDAVWPGVTVADGSLQRAVSLARQALAACGAETAIRTYSRQGYRWCAEAAGRDPAAAPASGTTAAQAAYAAGDWTGALAAYEASGGGDALAAEDWQRWAHAAQCAGTPHRAIGPLEQAVEAFTAQGDRRRAGWIALQIASLHAEWREGARAQGWHLRAARLLAAEPTGREHGYLDLLGSRLALLANEVESALRLAESARRISALVRDPDLENLSLVVFGEAALYAGHIRDGLAALDEAGASAGSSRLSAWAGGLIYCSVIYSCMTRADWQRAAEWTEQFTRWVADKGAAGYPGLCRMHRAEVLALRGHLSEAEAEIRLTIDSLARQAPWAEGDAWRVLGEILVARGAYAEAEAALQRAAELGWESHFNVALLRFAEGDAATARRLLAQSLAENAWSCRSKRGQALAYYAIVATADGQLASAREAISQLEAEPELTSTPALQALLCRARAEVAMADDRFPEGLRQFRAAIRTCQAINAPPLCAQIRCRLAGLLASQGDREAARIELTAAAPVLRQAGADGWLQRCETIRALLSPGASA